MHNVRSFRLQERDVLLFNIAERQGKIILTDAYYNNYSYYWGSMGSSSIEKFLIGTNAGYFVDKLLGHKDKSVFSHDKTMANIRKFIKSDVLPWYHQKEFQKDLRYELNNFGTCESIEEFVHSFGRLIDNLPYYNADSSYSQGGYDKKSLERHFKEMFSEPWHLAVTESSPEKKSLIKFHGELIKYLEKYPEKDPS